jgi:hypothetical protein
LFFYFIIYKEEDIQKVAKGRGRWGGGGGGGGNQALTPLFYVMLVPLLQWMALKQQMSSIGHSCWQQCAAYTFLANSNSEKSY